MSLTDLHRNDVVFPGFFTSHDTVLVQPLKMDRILARLAGIIIKSCPGQSVNPAE